MSALFLFLQQDYGIRLWLFLHNSSSQLCSCSMRLCWTNNINSGQTRWGGAQHIHINREERRKEGQPWQTYILGNPSHWLIIRDRTGRMEGMETKTERWRMRDCRDIETEGGGSYRALNSEGQSLLSCCLSCEYVRFCIIKVKAAWKEHFYFNLKEHG